MYDLGQKMIESLTKEKVQAGLILMTFALSWSTNFSFTDCCGLITILILF